MNALAVAIPNQSLVALAFLNGPSVLNLPKTVPNGTPAAAAFTDLINALFGSASLETESPESESPVTVDATVSDQVLQTQPPLRIDTTASQPQIQPTVQTNAAGTPPNDPTIDSAVPNHLELTVLPALAVPVATDANIAQAMIRSMLGVTKQSTNSSTISPTKSLPPKAADAKVAKAANKTTPAFLLEAVAAPVIVPFVAAPAPQEATPPANAPAVNTPAMNTSRDGFSQSLLKNPAIEIATLSAAQPQSNVPIAFAAKLIPIATQAQLTPDVAPLDDSDPATAPQPLPRNHAARFSETPETDEPVAPVAMAAAASSYSGGFSHSFQDTSQQNATPAITADPKTPAPLGTIGESMRASESMAIANAPAAVLSTAPAQSITMRINPPDGHSDMPVVDLQVSSRGNEIHVAVRTSDAQLESAMRQDLGTLSSSLDRAGYRTETYVPRDTVREIGHEIGFTAAQPSSGSQENRESSQDPSQQNFTGRDSGGSPDGRQQQGRQNQGQNQRQHHGQNQRFRNWIFEMEKQ